LKIRISIPESFRLFVSHEKSELSAEKTIQTTNWSLLAMASKISILATRCCVNPIFSTFARQQSAYYGHFSELLIGFRILKSLVGVSGKGQV